MLTARSHAHFRGVQVYDKEETFSLILSSTTDTVLPAICCRISSSMVSHTQIVSFLSYVNISMFDEQSYISWDVPSESALFCSLCFLPTDPLLVLRVQDRCSRRSKFIACFLPCFFETEGFLVFRVFPFLIFLKLVFLIF